MSFSINKPIIKREWESNNTDPLVLMPVELLPDSENSLLLKHLSERSPTDIINLSRDNDLELLSLWSGRDKKQIAAGLVMDVPSDMFFAGMVPLLDCYIAVDERDMYDGEGILSRCRVSIYEDYHERIGLAYDGEGICVGCIVPEYGSGEPISIIIPVMVSKGRDYLYADLIGWRGFSDKEKIERVMKDDFDFRHVKKMVLEWMSTWYGLQVALLHPLVKTVFGKPKRTVYGKTAKNGNKKKKRGRVKYIKEHNLSATNLKDIASGGSDRDFNRYTLVWYVIGHERTLKSGKKIFIKPCWKGPLREIKSKTESRERVIAQLTEE